MKSLKEMDLRSREEKRVAAKADARPRTTLSFYRYVQFDERRTDEAEHGRIHFEFVA